MLLYKIIRNGKITNSWTSDFSDETFYQQCFGKKERWIHEDECSQEEIENALESRLVEGEENYTEYKLAAEYELQVEDLGESVDFEKLRLERNKRLASCDWTQLADSPLTQQETDSWASYRQSLRDLPANTVDPKNPVWPQEP